MFLMTDIAQRLLAEIHAENISHYNGLGQFICSRCSRRWGKGYSQDQQDALEEYCGSSPDDVILILIQVALDSTSNTDISKKFAKVIGLKKSQAGGYYVEGYRKQDHSKPKIRPGVDQNTPVVADAVRKAKVQSFIDAGMTQEEAEEAAG